MLYVSVAMGALSLIIPTPTNPPAIVRPAAPAAALPSSTLLAGLFGPDTATYKGSAENLDLGSLLDSVPEDAGGKKGVKRDQEGLQRLKERQNSEQDAAKAKYEAVLAAEAAGKDVTFAGEVKESANAGIELANSLLGR